MAEIIVGTLTLARQGRVVSETEPVRLSGLVEDCWQTVSTGDATLDVAKELVVRGDRSRLRNVFENLFRNAVEHAGPDVTVRVGKLADTRFYVEDDGPGIPADARESVFEPGHTSASDSTGFGLTIVKRIAEAHGREVEIINGTDGGARFEFTGVELD
jgi:signal transduction histidine kinase